VRPFEEILNEHGDVVMRVCRAVLGPVDADDAWAETFVSAMRAYPNLRPDSNVRGWLVTIAHRKAIDVIRARTRAPHPVADVPERVSLDRAGDGPVEHDDELRAALQALPPKQRGAVVYRYLADMPYAHVASELEISEAAARRNAADGIANLRAHYSKGTSR
jgi:RNA polymerase sigma factor (sigma-70 family)